MPAGSSVAELTREPDAVWALACAWVPHFRSGDPQETTGGKSAARDFLPNLKLLCLRGNYHFHVERDVYIIADNNASAVELLVPGHAEVLPVDLCGSGHGGALQSPGILDGGLGKSCGQDPGLGDAPEGPGPVDFNTTTTLHPYP